MYDEGGKVEKVGGGKLVIASLEKLCTFYSQKVKTHKSRSTSIDIRSLTFSRALCASVKNHDRDAIVLLDNALHHPVVVTGIAEFAPAAYYRTLTPSSA